MPSDVDFEKYVRIGGRNREVIQLLENWCAHARVVSAGGVGMLEQATGLPIGMRRVTCVHERAPGIGSMHMAHNALDFHDRNCADCTERRPVRLPNLTELLRARDEARAQQRAAAEAEAAATQGGVERRAAARAADRTGAGPDVASVLDLLDAFDRAPTRERADTLAESARAAPDAFPAAVVRHVAAVADAGGDDRTAGALAVLGTVAVDADLHVAVALRALARGEATDQAAAALARELPRVSGGVGEEVSALLPGAMPVLVWLAQPIPSWAFMGEGRDAQPDGLLAAFAVAPEVVEVAVRRALRDPGRETRKAGAHAVAALLDRSGAEVGLRFMSDLLAGFAQPDNPYDSGDAAHTTAWALAELLAIAPEAVDPVLVRAAAQGGDAERLGILRTYIAAIERHDARTGRLERDGRALGRDRTPTAVEALAYTRVLDTLARLPADSDLLHAARGLLDYGSSVPAALERQAVPTLLGIAALAAAALTESDDAGSVLADPRPAALKGLGR